MAKIKPDAIAPVVETPKAGETIDAETVEATLTAVLAAQFSDDPDKLAKAQAFVPMISPMIASGLNGMNDALARIKRIELKLDGLVEALAASPNANAEGA